jgi:hypothetical protein
MALADRGPLLYAYKPIPANPMSVALLILLGVVTFVLGPLAALPEGLWPLGGLCFLPMVLVLLAVLAFRPSPTYVFENGIEISLPLWRRVIGEPRYFPWSKVRDIYPRSYEVAGSFLSPFASSAGTLVHVGIGLETKEGQRRLVRFTPGAIRGFRSESPGYRDAMAIIRNRYARHGEAMVTTAKALSDAEVLRMQEEARRPLVSISGVFLAFFLPPTIIGVAFLAASVLGAAVTAPLAIAGLVLAIIPPAASMLTTLRRSEQRNEILSELSKFQEHQREQAPSP